jgi:outer membrane usher protein
VVHEAVLALLIAAPAVARNAFVGGEPPPAAPEMGERHAALDLVVNTEPKGGTTVVLRGDDVLVPTADLRAAGLRGIAGARTEMDGRDYVSLRSLAPQIAYTVDDGALALRITADPALFEQRAVDLRSARPPELEQRRDTSGFFNYSARADTAGAVSAFAEAGASVSGNLLYTGWSRLTTGEVVRGLSSLTLDEPDALRRWIVGDAVESGTLLGGGGTLLGLAVRREYSLDPYFLRTPLPATRGFAATPSTLEVYVNGQLVRKEPIAPGTFDVLNLPLTSGDGSYRTVVRDAFGRTSEVSASYYYSTGVIGKGFHEYDYALGFQRRAFATASFDYGDPAFLGSHRYGVTEWLTAGARVEAAPTLASGGGVVTARTPVGEVELAAAASGAGARRGGAGSLSWSWLSQAISVGFLARLQSDFYANLSLAPGTDRALAQGNAFLAFRPGGPLGLVLEVQAQRNRDSGDQLRGALRADLAVFRSGTLSASVARTAGASAGTEAFVGFSWYLGNLTSLSAGATTGTATRGGSATVQRSIGDMADVGYRLEATQDRVLGQALSADVVGQGAYGRVEATGDFSSRANGGSLAASGGMVLIDGELLLARAVQNGYALVQVPGVAGVRGLVNNQVIGRTDAKGNLLVPNLIPYFGNRVSIDPVDLPLDREVGVTARTIATPLRGGAVVQFEAPRLELVTGELQIREQGTTRVPVFGELSVLTSRGEYRSPIGSSGQFALEKIPAGRYPARIETEREVCVFWLNVPPSAGGPLDLGKVSCAATPRGQTP